MATRRPDLEALPFKAPNFIGQMLLPRFTKAVKAGTIYYSDIISDASAQTDRTLTEAPTATGFASASDTYALAEYIKRMKIDRSEIEQCGGLDAAQAKGSRKAKRSVVKAHEDAVIALLFGGAAQHRDILASFDNALKLAIETIQDYGGDGKLALFGPRRTVDVLKRYTEITGKMIYTGMLNRDEAKDVRHISDEILAGAIGVDVVLAGPSTEWLGGGNAYAGMLGVCVLPSGDVDPDEEIQLGRTVCMNVDGGTDIFEVETYYSDDLKSEVVDCTAWLDPEIYNLELVYLLKGIDEANTVKTTAG